MNVSILIEGARITKLQALPDGALTLGKIFGSAGEDSEGRALVFQQGGQFLSGYVAGDTVILLDHIKHDTFEAARDAAEAFTRAACEG